MCNHVIGRPSTGGCICLLAWADCTPVHGAGAKAVASAAGCLIQAACLFVHPTGCFGFIQSVVADVCVGVHQTLTFGKCSPRPVGMCSQQPKCIVPLHAKAACEYIVETENDLNS